MRRAEALAAVRAAVKRDVDAMERMVEMSRDEATNAQSKPENKYDTRALEASYLAAGQGRRLGALRQLAGWIEAVGDAREAVGAGSLLRLDGGPGSRWLLLGPVVGPTVEVSGLELSVISTASPLGSVVLGLEQGDEVQFRGTELELAFVG